MLRPASLGTLTALMLGAVAWACSGSAEENSEPEVAAPEQAAAPAAPTPTNADPPLPPSSSSDEPANKTAKDAGPGSDAKAPGDGGAKTPDAGKPAPPPPPASCPGTLESEPNDDPRGEYDKLGAITCGSISPTDVDHFYVESDGDPIRYTFEAEKGAKLELWTIQGPIKTFTGTVDSDVVREDRKVFFRVSAGTAVQTYRITLTRR